MDLPYILTTISLKLLSKFDQQKSLVFSPVEVALKLANNSLESGEPNEVFEETPDIVELVEKLNGLKSNSENQNLTSTIWRYPLLNPEVKPFHFDEGSQSMEFISMEADLNQSISCEQEENKYNEDEVFRVLSIPLAQESLFFVIFLPIRSLIEALEKLETDRFQNLIENLTDNYINFELPLFKIESSVELHGISPINQGFEISNQNIDGKCTVTEKRSTGMIKKPCETIPIEFPVNRPFLFCVIQENVPLIMGMFKGN